ncbi:MAG: flagellar biosynthesis repressor FlbT [Parvularculaceae bacterium]
MTLKLTLKPGERVAINGAVIVNGDRRSTFAVENQARILREKDILHPNAADSPAKRIYLPIMMMALDPDQKSEFLPHYQARLAEFTDAIADPGVLQTCARLAVAVANEEFYLAMTLCRRLMEFERVRLAHVA